MLSQFEVTRLLYWQRAPIPVVLDAFRAEAGTDDWTSLESQEALYDAVVAVDAHAAAPEYQAKLLKTYTGDCVEMSDNIAGALALVMTTPPRAEQSDLFEKVIPIAICGERLRCRVRVGPQFKNVGMSLWPAAFALIDLFLRDLSAEEPVVFRRDAQPLRITELGAGVGLTACVVEVLRGIRSRLPEAQRARLESIHALHQTDYLPDVLANCKHNIDASVAPTETPVSSVHNLNWFRAEDNEEFFRTHRPNLLIAADVMYDVEVCDALAITVVAGLRSANSDDARCIIFATHRNAVTVERFMGSIRAYGCLVESRPCAIDGGVQWPPHVAEAVRASANKLKGPPSELRGWYWVDMPDLLVVHTITLPLAVAS